MPATCPRIFNGYEPCKLFCHVYFSMIRLKCVNDYVNVQRPTTLPHPLPKKVDGKETLITVLSVLHMPLPRAYLSLDHFLKKKKKSLLDLIQSDLPRPLVKQTVIKSLPLRSEISASVDLYSFLISRTEI